MSILRQVTEALSAAGLQEGSCYSVHANTGVSLILDVQGDREAAALALKKASDRLAHQEMNGGDFLVYRRDSGNATDAMS